MLPRGVQTLPIPFVRGVDAKSDPHVVVPPELIALDNVVFDRPGSLRKRLGTVAAGTGASTSSYQVLARFRDQLLQLGGGNLYSLGGGSWRNAGTLAMCSLKSRVVAQSSSSLAGADRASTASSLGRLTATAWRSRLDGHVYATVTDETTGATVLAASRLSAATGTSSTQVIAQGGYLVVLYVTGGTLKGRTFNPGSPSAWGAEASFATLGTVNAFSASAGTGATDYFHVVTRDTSTNQVKLAGLSPATPSLSVAAVTFGTAYPGASGVLSVAQQGTRVCVLAEEYVGELHTWVRQVSNYAAVADVSNGGISASVIKNGTICASNASGGWLAWVTVLPSATVSDPSTGYIQTLYVKTDATQNNTATVLRGCSVASQGLGFASTDTGWAWVRWWTQQQSAYLLVDQAGALVGRALPGQVVALGGGAGGTLPHLGPAASTNYASVLAAVQHSSSGTDADAVAAVVVDPTYRPRPAEGRSGLFIPGALPRVYTGSQLVEAGFLAIPEARDAVGQTDIGARTARAATTAYVLNDLRRPAAPNGILYKCTTAGTSSAGTPTWPTTIGATVVDGTVTWTAWAYSVIARLNSTSFAVGSMIQPFGGNGYWYECVVAGTTAGTAPTFTGGYGDLITDGGVTWRCMGPMGTNPAQADGTRSYKAVYEWMDENGEMWRSAPSLPISVAVSGMSGTGASLISVSTLQLTAKSGVRIAVYRTDVSGTLRYMVANVPNDSTVSSLRILDITGDTPSAWSRSATYSVGDRVSGTAVVGLEGRCTTAGVSAGYEPVWPAVVGDTVTDGTAVWTMQASIAGQPELYTDAGELPSGAPPACTVATSVGGRFVIAGLETDGQSVQYSKNGLGGVPTFPAFDLAGLLSYLVGQEGGGITALAPLDASVVAFKRTRAAVLSGSPPDDSGNGGTIDTATPLPVDAGALSPHGVVADTAGLYLASARGIYRLTRGGQSEYVGAPIEAYEATVYGAAVMTGRTEVRFATSAGVFVFNTLLGQWSRHTGMGTVLDVACYQDLAAYALSGAVPVTETPDAWLDGASPVLVSLTTGHIAPAGPNAWCRLARFLFTGQLLDDCDWTWTIHIDGTQLDPQTVSLHLDDALTPDGSLGSDCTLRIDITQMRGRSVQLVLAETSATDTAGLALTAGALLWAPVTPDAKVPSGQQKS